MGKAEKPADRPVSYSPYVYSLVSLSRITLYKYKFYKSAFPFVKETCVLEKNRIEANKPTYWSAVLLPSGLT